MRTGLFRDINKQNFFSFGQSAYSKFFRYIDSGYFSYTRLYYFRIVPIFLYALTAAWSIAIVLTKYNNSKAIDHQILIPVDFSFKKKCGNSWESLKEEKSSVVKYETFSWELWNMLRDMKKILW
jgi:hypothetical protein